MARAAVQRRLTWQLATVQAATDEPPQVRTLTLGVPGWPGHLAGQHLDVRLTAEDGYQAEREYSVAAAPGEQVAITVERLDDGEVSPYLTQELRAGDEIEIRGPVGGYFVWRPEDGGPLLLIAGGSGVVPLRAMLRAPPAVQHGAGPAHLLRPQATGRHLLRRTDAIPGRPQSGRRRDAHKGAATWLDRAHRSGRRGAAARGCVAFGAAAAGLCLRADGLRRGRERHAGSLGLLAAARQDRTVRRDGRTLMDALDGNAIAGLLHEVFSSEMTTATGICATCGSAGVGQLDYRVQRRLAWQRSARLRRPSVVAAAARLTVVAVLPPLAGCLGTRTVKWTGWSRRVWR